jgi:hypothetical protein
VTPFLAQETAAKVREKHLIDFSAGCRAVESFRVPEGQKQVIAGRTREGPLRVTTRWKVNELSITPVGADEGAKARQAPSPNRGSPKPETTGTQPRKPLGGATPSTRNHGLFRAVPHSPPGHPNP